MVLQDFVEEASVRCPDGITVQKASGDHLVQQANRGFHQTAFRTTDYAGREPVPFDYQYGAASGFVVGTADLVIDVTGWRR
jgi:hypothetical protein